MHDLYVSFDVKSLQKEMFRKRSFPRVVMNPQDANREFIRGNVELVRLSEAEGRVAAEGRCPIRRGYYAWCPARSGAGQYCAISSRWRRGQYAAGLLTGAAGGLQRDGSGWH
jgi:ornithine decarboxylase